MNAQRVITALERLGLSNYQARVFVALQQLGIGTTQEISDVSDVPRSQVYGAADDLAERGLVEVIESSPKRYRPVRISTAHEQLATRLERERRDAFEALAELEPSPSERPDEQGVSTLRGRTPIDDRIGELIENAETSVVFVAPAGESLSTDLEAVLRSRVRDGVSVTIVTADERGRERFSDDPVEVLVMGEDNPADFAGRALTVDDSTVLLSVATDDDVASEEAMWTANTRIGRILAQFMQSGIESGMNRNAPR